MVRDLAASVAADPTGSAITVATYGFAGTALLALVTLVLGILTNRTEKQKVANATVEAADERVETVLRERIAHKDDVIRAQGEKIREQDDEIDELNVRVRELEEEHARCRLAVEETRAEERARLNERRRRPDAK